MFTEINCYTGQGSFYIGDKSQTIDGLTCQDWLDQSPHNHPFVPTTFRRYRYDLIQNRCRNPDLVNRRQPWCYTTNSSMQWQYCDVQKCPTSPQNPTVGQPIKNCKSHRF